jgi:hypothetical protein
MHYGSGETSPRTDTIMSSDQAHLPEDLTTFLQAGKQLQYDYDSAEPGQLTLKALSDLRVADIYHSSAEEGHAPGHNEEPGAGWDPHIEDDNPGYYAIPAVDLVASITGDYDPQALLFWLPNEHMYGTWDSGHLELLVFPDTTWTDIAAAPARYVTAQWSTDPPGYYFAPWQHGYAHRTGLPPRY